PERLAVVVPPVVAETDRTALSVPGVPACVGANFTPTVQLSPPASVLPVQLSLESANSPALEPVSVAVRAVVAAPPVVLTGKVCPGLVCPAASGLNVPWSGESESAPGSTPMPDSMTVAVPPGVAPTCSFELFAPDVPGMNLTVTVQLAPGSRVMPLHMSALV